MNGGQVVSFKDLGRQLTRDEQLARLEAWQPDTKRYEWEDSLEAQRPAGVADNEWNDFTDHAARCYSVDEPLKITHSNGGLQAVGLGIHGEQALQLRKGAGRDAEVWVPQGSAPAANDDDAWLETPAESPFRVIEAAEFAGGEYIEPDWQVHELVPKQGSGLDIGESKTWKSFKVLELATCINRGTPYRGRPVQKGRSVIVVAEGTHGYPLRMQALAKHLGCPLSELPAIIPAAPNLFDPNQIKELIVQLKILGATYVALDTKWRCSLGADENSAKDNAIIFGSIDAIARKVGCFCTAISHVGKDPSKGVRGSSSQFAAVDVEVTHEREGDYGKSTVTKLKDAQDGAVFTVKMLPVELGVSRKTGKPYGSLVVDHVDDAPVAKGAKLPAHGSLLRTALDTVKALIVAEGGPVDLEEARVAIIETKTEPEPGARDRRGSRAGTEIDTLRRQGFIDLVDGKITDTRVVKGAPDGKDF